MKDKIKKSNTFDEGLGREKEGVFRRNILRENGCEYPRTDIM